MFLPPLLSVATYLVHLDPVLKVNETMGRVRHTQLYFSPPALCVYILILFQTHQVITYNGIMGVLSYVFTAIFISVATYLVHLDPVFKVNETMGRVRHTQLYFSLPALYLYILILFQTHQVITYNGIMGALSYVFTATFISAATYLVHLDPVLNVNETMWRVRHTWLFLSSPVLCLSTTYLVHYFKPQRTSSEAVGIVRCTCLVISFHYRFYVCRRHIMCGYRRSEEGGFLLKSIMKEWGEQEHLLDLFLCIMSVKPA